MTSKQVQTHIDLSRLLREADSHCREGYYGACLAVLKIAANYAEDLAHLPEHHGLKIAEPLAAASLVDVGGGVADQSRHVAAAG